jgi:VIT1/CCC1 family predicted Fe2+/Mn2+ transporter
VAGLTESEKKTLFESARKIWTYKLMQATGYKGLVKRARDQRTRQLLEEIGINELNEAGFWLQKVKGLADGGRRTGKVSFLKQRIGLMMSVLGTRGYFEWTIIAEDEAVEGLAIQAANIGDLAASEEWTRTASDERLHIERVKKEVLGMEGWEMGGGGGVRDVIFGANDGLVSILALVAGVYGAITESHPILIAGIAGAVAGAISMGAGAYLSAKSDKEVTEKESDRKGIKRKGTPGEEKENLIRFYQSRGFNRRDAEAVADRVAGQAGSEDSYTVGEELGLTSEESWPPTKAALFTGLTFAIVSLIPILPFASMEVNSAVITAAVASIGCLFIVGASKAIFSRKSWVRSGVEMMAIGTLASMATYAIGLVIPV